jgi:hypothetical protein
MYCTRKSSHQGNLDSTKAETAASTHMTNHFRMRGVVYRFQGRTGLERYHNQERRRHREKRRQRRCKLVEDRFQPLVPTVIVLLLGLWVPKMLVHSLALLTGKKKPVALAP